jgi:eukaryotic-like serine/threonine-protein kinase
MISPGTLLGPYQITAKLGEGGMGEVWRATDTKLEREVAIKILAPALAADADALARFEREAKAVAALSHPNILAIFDFGRAGEIAYAAMELLEGETLREPLAAGALPARKATEIAAQVATGLAAAHERGVVHRDLKPENLFLTREGSVKILDFGLARQDEQAGASSQLLAAPTLGPRTAAGTVLGTVGYMAPEQVRGETADARADIFSLGVVLYEMLTGRRAFEQGSAVETMSAILREDPPELETLSERASPELARLLERCLEKRPEERFQSARDLAFDLRALATGSGRSQAGGRALAAGRPWRTTALRWALGAALVAAGAGLGHVAPRTAGGVHEAPTAPPWPSFRQLTKLPGGEGSPTLSPDGETFVYVKSDGGGLDLFSQRVDGTTAMLLTADCDRDNFDPAFSPDGRWIAFRSECDGGGVFVMGATGEARRRVSDFGFAPAWSPDGRELAVVTERLMQPTSRQSTSQLWAVRVDSGERRLVSAHDAMGPTWSPDGRRIAFWGLKGDTFQRDLWRVAADGSQSAPEAAIPILDDPPLDWAPVYSRDGRWLYFVSTRGGTYNLWRFALDPATGEPVGAPEPVTAPSSSAGPFALSADGSRIVYVDFNMRTEIVRAPFDPSRRALAAAPVPVFSGSFEQREQNLSPAGDWIVFTNEDPPQQLHLMRSDGTGYRQLTTDGDRHRQGEFSPDGAWLVFQTTRGGFGLAAIRTDGGGWQSVASERGLSNPRWSPDGSTIAAFDSDTGAVLFDVRGGLSAAPSGDLPPVAEGVLFWPRAWSPDGALLAGFGSREGQNRSLVVRSTSSGEYRTVAPMTTEDGFGTLAFLDRRLLAYASNHAISLSDLDAAGEPKLFYAPRAGRTVANLAASRDGRWLTWIERADESDIWLMTLDDEAPGRPRP